MYFRDSKSEKLYIDTVPFCTKYNINPAKYSGIDISQCNFLNRLYNILMRMGISALDDLLSRNMRELYKIKNFGIGLVNELGAYLEKLSETGEIRRNIFLHGLLSEHIEEIIAGDFSFVEGLSFNQKEKETLDNIIEASVSDNRDFIYKCFHDKDSIRTMLYAIDHFADDAENYSM